MEFNCSVHSFEALCWIWAKIFWIPLNMVTFFCFVDKKLDFTVCVDLGFVLKAGPLGLWSVLPRLRKVKSATAQLFCPKFTSLDVFQLSLSKFSSSSVWSKSFGKCQSLDLWHDQLLWMCNISLNTNCGSDSTRCKSYFPEYQVNIKALGVNV